MSRTSTHVPPRPPKGPTKKQHLPENAERMAREPHRVGKPPGRPTATANPVPTRKRVKSAR